MINEELKEKLEDVFIEWQLELDRDQQEKVRFGYLDKNLQMVFLERALDFDLEKLDSLREKMKDVEDGFLVGTINLNKEEL